MADEDPQLLAGHPPAGKAFLMFRIHSLYPIITYILYNFHIVKAGGMRIVQHKTPTSERVAKDQEDCTGLTNPPSVISGTVSGAPVKGNSDYTPEAAQVAHAHKPEKSVNIKPQINIQQPRK